MINIDGHDLENWKDYFKSTFESTYKYNRIEKEPRGETFIEQYFPKDIANKTIIEVKYLQDSGKLISLHYYNPQTKGFSEQQKAEYFCHNEFTPEGYGVPGLEFNDLNVQEIDKQLRQGLKGKEIQYYKNGQIVKSRLFICYFDDNEGYPNTIYFEKRSFLKKLIDLFLGRDRELTTEEIDLKTIFGGLQEIKNRCALPLATPSLTRPPALK